MEDVDRPMDFSRVLTHCQVCERRVWAVHGLAGTELRSRLRTPSAAMGVFVPTKWFCLDSAETSLMPWQILKRTKTAIAYFEDQVAVTPSFRDQVHTATAAVARNASVAPLADQRLRAPRGAAHDEQPTKLEAFVSAFADNLASVRERHGLAAGMSEVDGVVTAAARNSASGGFRSQRLRAASAGCSVFDC